jgi:hypothetical protein
MSKPRVVSAVVETTVATARRRPPLAAAVASPAVVSAETVATAVRAELVELSLLQVQPAHLCQ